jgi:hypothetical protein
MKIKGFLAVGAIAALLLSGCENVFDVPAVETNGRTATPFADEDSLNAIAAMDGFVDWKVARFFALNELDDSRIGNSWEGAWLSEYPLVVYNGETGNPRYYEFRVIRGDSELGAITCVAEKAKARPFSTSCPLRRK